MAIKKFIIYLLVFFVILIAPLKIVYLEELETNLVTREYNNYYFFEEPFSEAYAGRETYNYGIFAPPKLGHSNDKLELVILKKNGQYNDEIIDTFYEFYDKKGKPKIADFIYFRTVNSQDQYCLISSYEEFYSGVTNIYYMHSCYKNKHGWSGYYTKVGDNKYCDKNGNCIISGTEIKSEVNILERSCASVDRFSGNGASIEQVKVANDGIVSGDKYYVYKITRKNIAMNDVNIGNNFNVDANNPSCPNNEEDYVNPTHEGKMYSPVLGKYSYNVKYYRCENKPVNENSNCNSSKTFNQTCNNTTIEAGNVDVGTSARADFMISQTGTISNVVTPNTIYQGGGINIGFTYYNTVTWKYISDLQYYSSNISEENAKYSLLSALKDKIKSKDSIENGLSVSFNFTPEVSLTSDVNNNIVKKCEQSIIGSFEEGMATTVCTVFLPVTKITPYTGKISGISAIEGKGINNKMYTDLSFYGLLNFSATVSGLNVLKEGSDWTITYNPNNDDKSCQINVYSRLYAEKNDDNNQKFNKYKFIYRPIDLNNPFPGRVAGANWFDWYSKQSNKDRLKESYNKLQYRVELNPTRVAKIKEYNNDKNYLDWDDFENDKSPFIEEFSDYFDPKGQNIVGDSS